MIIEVSIWVIVYLSVYCTLLTLVIFFAKRDVKLGLKKWFLFRTGRQPVVLRYYGANLNVSEHVVATRGVGDKVDVFDKKFFGLKKTGNGSTFFLDETYTRRRDDGFNELSYSYKSVMPLSPDDSVVSDHNSKIKLKVEEMTKDLSEDGGRTPMSIDNNTLYTDPKRLNRFIEWVKTAAKAEALEAAGADVLKWTKFATFAAGGAVIMGVLIWYSMDSQLYPMIEQLGRQIADVGRGLIEV